VVAVVVGGTVVVSAVVVVVSSVLTTGDGTVDVAAVSGSAAQDPMMKVEAKIIANLLMLPPAQWRRILSVGDGVGSNICSDCVLGERIRRVALSHEFLLDGGPSGGAILHLPPATYLGMFQDSYDRQVFSAEVILHIFSPDGQASA
jgi:hypothetical protein